MDSVQLCFMSVAFLPAPGSNDFQANKIKS